MCAGIKGDVDACRRDWAEGVCVCVCFPLVNREWLFVAREVLYRSEWMGLYSGIEVTLQLANANKECFCIKNAELFLPCS